MIFHNKEIMNIVITINCDSKCKHCYIKSVDDNSSKDLSLDIWKETILKFRESGGKEISIHGGEPLMYKGIDELLIYANSIGLSTSIITNTFHLNENIIKALSQSNTYVLVSLDGPRENYMTFRGEDKLDRVIENIDKMLEKNIPIHPISVIHNKNIGKLSWLIDFVIKRDIKKVTLSPIQPIGRASEQEDFHISHENISRLIDTIKDLNHKYYGKVKFVTQALFQPQNLDKYLANKEALLTYNDNIVNVLNDGRVLIDLDLPNREDYVIGSIFNISKVNKSIIDNYKNLVNKAYLTGLNKLKNKKAINYFETIQREALK